MGRSSLNAWRRHGHDHIDVQLDEFLCQRREAVVLRIGETPLELDVFALDIAEFAHLPEEGAVSNVGVQGRRSPARDEQADAP